MASPANFHCLEQRLRWTGQLTLLTALHVGASKGVDAADMPVLRDVEGYPFIPGASIKGVLRSTAESLVRALGQPRTARLWACDPLLDQRESAERACGVQAPHQKRSEVDVTQHCAICRLFGSRLLASHVRISDALIPEAQRRRRPPIELRDGVGIDRDRRVARGRLKYDFEVVSPGTTFDLELFVENPEPWLMGLLCVALDQVKEGFCALGGFTSRGLGRATLTWESIFRFTAKSLLEGREPEVLDGERIAEAMRMWRAALASEVKGGVHVQG
ncbi:MAG: CRISPR-associated RAMP protein [Polyangiaceae bacterium]|nr:CRISPR-associated RAMP protein [Polyangiaceae bacterium]